jgi:hypothetical protein
MLARMNHNTAFDKYSHRHAFSNKLPQYGIDHLLKMYWLEVGQLKRGYDPTLTGQMIPEGSESRYLQHRGLITSVTGKGGKLFCLTRAGIVMSALLLLGGDDQPYYHRTENELDSLFPVSEKVRRKAVLRSMLKWGNSEFDSSNTAWSYPPISVEQVMAAPPYQS